VKRCAVNGRHTWSARATRFIEREHVATTHKSGGARRAQTIDAQRSNPGALRARDASAMRSAAALSSARSSGVAVVPSSLKPSASQAAMALVVVMKFGKSSYDE